MITIGKIPFQIDFPLKILSSKKINFEDKRGREKVFKRHIYYYKYGKIRNSFLEARNKLFLSLAKEVVIFLKRKYPKLKVLNVSVFGSSLYSKNPGDFDFLVIVKGNVFLYEKVKLVIKENEVIHPVGISVKGIENFSKGVFDVKSNVSLNLQSQVIYRTTISLFRRHIPVIGFDFLDNRKTFLNNGYAQISDLLNNAYELYYLKSQGLKLNNKERSRKILSRAYEAISYISFLDKDTAIKDFRKEIATKIEKGVTLSESKRILDKLILIYKKKTLRFDKINRNKKEVLRILSNKILNEHITRRLENYWRSIKLPYFWVRPILDILSKHHYDEDLAIKEVRRRFPSIVNINSLSYSKKLRDFRRIKVKNLAKRIKNDVCGKLIADVGGRSDDFVEQILLLKKSIKKAYVTDLCSFTTRSKDPKIDFVVQSSLTRMPFTKKSIDTIILSMVLHHLKDAFQKDMLSNLISSLKNKGRIILIEDTFPGRINLNDYDKIMREFLSLKSSEKRRVLYFYDWFGNRLMRNRDNIPLFCDYRTMDEWKKIFKKFGVKEIKSEFVKESLSHPDIFPPKAIMVFQKR